MKQNIQYIRLMALLFPALLSWNCISQPEKPVAPSWDVNLTIPVANRTYTLAEIVEKDTGMLKVGVGSQIIYSTSVSADPTFVGDVITLNIPPTAVNLRLGAFHVTTPPISTPIGIPWLPQGMNVPVPDTTITLAEVRDTITSFERMVFESGTIALTLTNNLPVLLDVVNPIQLRDAQNNVVVVFSFSPSSINPNGSQTSTANLAGKTLDKVVRLTGLNFHTPGSITPVHIPSGALIVVSLATSNLVAQSATLADIPPQLLNNTDSAVVLLDDSTLIKEVRIKSGRLSLVFENNVDLAISFRFTLSELQRRVGNQFVPFMDSVLLNPRGSTTFMIDLAETKIQSNNGNLVRELNIVSSMNLMTVPGQPVTLNWTDNVRISIAQTAPIRADSAVAVLKPTWVNVNTRLPIDFGELPSKFHGQLNVPSALLVFATESSIGFPMDLDVRFTARKANGTYATLNVPSNQKRLASGSDQIVFDPVEAGAFLSQFSGGLPESLFVTGSVLVNPPDAYTPTIAGIGTVGAASSFAGTVQIEVPVMLGITDGSYIDTLVVGDTTRDGSMDVIINSEQIKNVNYGKTYIEVENGLPLEVRVSGNLLNAQGLGTLLLPQSGQPLVVTAAMVDGDGHVIIPAKSRLLVEMNNDEVQRFNVSKLLALGVLLSTSPGSPVVRFKTTDTIRFRVWSELSYRVNP